MEKGLTLGALVFVLIAATAVYFLGYVPGTQPAILRIGQDAAAAALIDPSSAQFRKLKTALVIEGTFKGKPAVCGEINGKNRNGAYAGFSRFIAGGEEGMPAMLAPNILIDEDDYKQHEAECDNALRETKSGNSFAAVTGEFECKQALAGAKERANLAKFDSSWKEICSSDVK